MGATIGQGAIDIHDKADESCARRRELLKMLDLNKKYRKKQQPYREHFGDSYQGDFIFCNPDGSPLKPDTISASVSLLFRGQKLPRGASLHSLRHTHGSHLLAAGVPLTDVSKRLGHSNPHVTAMIYAHALEGRDDLAAKAWEKFQSEGKQPVKPARARRTA